MDFAREGASVPARLGKETMPQKRRAKAYYEAGHAVIGYRLNVHGERASSPPDPGSPWPSTADGRNRHVAITALAGLASKRLVQPEAPINGTARDDYERAAAVASELAVPVSVLEGDAAALVAKERAAIEAVAATLLEYDTHSEDETIDAAWAAWSSSIQRVDQETLHLLRAAFEAGFTAGKRR